MNTNDKAQSTFVTVLAWIFIVLAGLATLISIVQNIMTHTMFLMGEIEIAMNEVKGESETPAFAKFMFANFQLFFFAFLLVSLTTFVSAIALLRRKNWARIVFICLMALGIVWNIGGLVLQQSFVSSMGQFPVDAPAEFESQFRTIATIILVFSAVLAIGLSVLFGWIIKRLMSPTIRQEFS